MRKLCKQLDERFVCPLQSPFVAVKRVGSQIELDVADGSRFRCVDAMFARRAA